MHRKLDLYGLKMSRLFYKLGCKFQGKTLIAINFQMKKIVSLTTGGISKFSRVFHGKRTLSSGIRYGGSSSNAQCRCFCSIVNKRSTHLAHSFFMSKFSVNMRCTALF